MFSSPFSTLPRPLIFSFQIVRNRNVKSAQSAIFTILNYYGWNDEHDLTKQRIKANRTNSRYLFFPICGVFLSYFICAHSAHTNKTHTHVLNFHSMHSFSMRCIRPYCMAIQPPSYIFWLPLPPLQHTQARDQVFHLVMCSWALQSPYTRTIRRAHTFNQLRPIIWFT